MHEVTYDEDSAVVMTVDGVHKDDMGNIHDAIVSPLDVEAVVTKLREIRRWRRPKVA